MTTQPNDLMGLYNMAIRRDSVFPAGTGGLWDQYNRALESINPATGAKSGGVASGYGTGIGSPSGGVDFNIAPGPLESGQGPYGKVPGLIGEPKSRWDETMDATGMADLTKRYEGVLGNQMSGQLSPDVIESLTNSAASRGQSLGAGGGMTSRILMNTMGLSEEALQQQGMGNYMSFLGQVGGMQNNPELLAEIASRNATMLAAPDPTMAGQRLESLASGGGGGFSAFSGPGGGGGGGGGGDSSPGLPARP